MSPVEFTPNSDTPLADDVTNLFYRDFYLSFMYSQGDPNLQGELYDYIATIYRASLPQSDQERLLTVSSAKLQSRKFNIPGKHLTHDPIGTLITNNIDDWDEPRQEFHAALTTVFESTSLAPIHRKSPVGLTAIRLTIARDIHYQENPRGMNTDLHASYFRQHVLLAEPTKSPTYNNVFAGLQDSWRAIITAGSDSLEASAQDVAELEIGWDANHPLQIFRNGIDPALLS